MALAAQGFTRRRPAQVAPRHVHAAMERMHVLQIDSVNVFARSHYLPLYARLGAYDPALLDRLFLERTTHYVEYLAHEATFVPAHDWPLWRFRMDDFRRRFAGADSWTSQHTRTLDWVRGELRDRGPLRPADLRDDAPRRSGPWWDWDDVKLALEHLWRIGEVAIGGRRGFERTYALAEDVIAHDVLTRQIDRDDAIRELVRRAALAHGVATAADIADYHRIRDRVAVHRAIDELVDAGELVPVRVPGWQHSGRPARIWRHRDAVLPRRVDATTVLTPFDPVVWFRDRALRVFGLDYRIEIYVPAHRRQYGYYSLPVLIGDRIAARVDLKADRAAGALRVQSAWWEPSAQPDDVEPLAAELTRAAAWQGLGEVTVSDRGTAADDVAAALAALPGVSTGRHRHPND